jgi:hypothetical protein
VLSPRTIATIATTIFILVRLMKLLFFVARGDPVLGLVADDRLDSLGSTYAMLVKQLDTGLQADHLQELQTYFFFGWQHTPISFLARNR